jgi:hypothetical protein
VIKKLSDSRLMVTAAWLRNRRRCKNNPHNLGTTAALARRNDHEQGEFSLHSAGEVAVD